MRLAAPPASGEALWRAENVEFTTVGIDIGSATSHLQFSRVHLQRRSRGLSSRFVVVDRTALYRSPVIFTPYLADDDGNIDAAALGRFAERERAVAGLAPAQVDSGAVILTGEAAKRQNARPLAVTLAEHAGVFVCATAGHHFEAKLAAHGSGAVALSAITGQVVAHLDIGGGTTKLALLQGGRVLATAAVAVGGRLLVFDSGGALEWVSEAGAHLASAVGVQLATGRAVTVAERARIAAEMARLLVSLLACDIPARHRPLLLAEPHRWLVPQIVTFSGGVAEYLYGRTTAEHGDLGAALGAAIRDAMAPGPLPWPPPDPGEGIRATVIGSSQFSVEVSGNTISVPDPARLPLRDVPVAVPSVDLTGDVDALAVATQVGAEWRRLGGGASQRPVALAFRWAGDPSHQRLRGLAEGISAGTAARAAGVPAPAPVVVLVDGDVGRGLGRILVEELNTDRFICLDGVEAAEFDYVDIGSVARPAGVVPIVVKSLLFGGSQL